ncbi:Galectin-3 [Liparis tanakae]|uniref:Galectin n=1 Tax=Liparis tanakae TaxID=230148 RepID=A0A4Z2FKV3_9TELE|nr:Galectin-3 [Liparis tanakae]
MQKIVSLQPSNEAEFCGLPEASMLPTAAQTISNLITEDKRCGCESTHPSGALCGSCPSSGSAPQANSLWPSLPGQPAQPAQPAPCWTGQPNTPSVGAPAAATVTTVVQGPAQVAGPVQPCWPGTQCQPPQYQPTQYQPTQYQPQQYQPPQYQPTQYQPPQYQPTQYQPPQYQPTQYQPPQYQPTQYQPPQTPAPAPAPALTPVPVPVPSPTPAISIRPNVPVWPAHLGWPYNPGQSGWPGQNPSVMPHWLQPTSGPLTVPYNVKLPRGVYDKMTTTILGRVKPDAKMFTVNFVRGKDIAFHINPRFSEEGKEALVRNHRVAERWGPEERDLKGPFPFAPGSPFEMKILCTREAFRVAVDGAPLFEFQHRVRELNQIDRIDILHDVVLTAVNPPLHRLQQQLGVLLQQSQGLVPLTFDPRVRGPVGARQRVQLRPHRAQGLAQDAPHLLLIFGERPVALEKLVLKG